MTYGERIPWVAVPAAARRVELHEELGDRFVMDRHGPAQAKACLTHDLSSRLLAWCSSYCGSIAFAHETEMDESNAHG